MASPDETHTPPVRSCPDCGARVQRGQRRCTNCGASVEQRRRLARRTPLVAALVVAAIGGGAVVVAQAAVTDQATMDAAAPPDPASAPVQVAGAALPAAEKPTSSAPRTPEPEAPTTTSPSLTIPSLDTDVVGDANDARNTTPDDSTSKDGENTDDDKGADPNDLGDAKKLKIKDAESYDPNMRVGVEFGKAKAAIDKRGRTVWDVNVPADGQDFGVGIVLDLGSTKRVSSLRIQTPTPKFGATIYRADVPELPEKLEDPAWEKAADVKNVSDDVVVPLSDEPEWARYILLWLTTPRSDTDTRVALSNLEVLP